MKRLIVLLCVLTCCLCSDEYRETEHEREDGRYYDDRYDDDDRYYDNDNNRKDGERDDVDEYRRHLCPKRDLHCVRQVLSEIFQCTPLHERRGDRYLYDDIYLTIPHANASFIWRNAIAKGFRNFRINELYVNKRTNTLVFEVSFKSVIVNSPKSTLVFYRKGMEPIYTHDFVNVNYRDFSLTLTIDHRHDSKKPSRHIYSYLSEGFPPLNLGPKLVPRDPDAMIAFTQTQTNLPTTVKELFVVQGQEFFALFLNTAICELNIKTYPKH